MNRATPKMRDFAKRLITHEARENELSDTKVTLIFPVGEKLRPHLATFMGNTGFHALISRALTLASAEVAWLRGVRVKKDGALAGLDELETQLGSEEIFEGRVVLLAQLLGLLVTFVGEKLTVHLVCEIWPELFPKDLNLDIGVNNEKTK